MNVGTISLVGISVVFFTFVVLFFLFKLLAKIFGDKKRPELKKTMVSNNMPKTIKQLNSQQEEELVAVITAAIASYTTNDFKVLNIIEKSTKLESRWKNQKPKIWRPLRKGVKRKW